MPPTPNRRQRVQARSSSQHDFIGSSPMRLSKPFPGGGGGCPMPFSESVGFVGIDDSSDSFLMMQQQLGISPMPVAVAASPSVLPAPIFDDSDAMDWDLARLKQADDNDDDEDDAVEARGPATFRASPSEPSSSAAALGGGELSRMSSAPLLPPPPPPPSSSGRRGCGSSGFKRPSPMSTCWQPAADVVNENGADAEAPAAHGTPKRRRLSSARPLGDLTNATPLTVPPLPPCLHRCASELPGGFHSNRQSESVYTARVDKAITSIDSLNLIGNSEQQHSLPTVKELNYGIRYVTGATVSHLVNGGFDGTLANYAIIDCRYPYEFAGGHIQGATNIYTQEDLLKRVLEPAQRPGPASAKVLIFHCEFSSERAPKLARFLRQRDREANAASYPDLYFPEVYVLQGGYKSFYECHTSDCQPSRYVKMADPVHKADLAHFQRATKAWERQNSRSRHTQLERMAVSDRFF